MSLIDLKEKLISFVYESSCCLCDQPLGAGQLEPDRLICDQCHEAAVGQLLDRCYFCSGPTTFENPFGSRCRLCRNWRGDFERALAIGHYSGILRDAILAVKRDCDDVLAFRLGRLLGVTCERLDLPDTIDAVVPVPSHWWRRMGRRGFHAAEVIAEGFCQSSGMKLYPALKCVRHSKKQSKLRPAARIKNVRGAFAVHPRKSVQDMQVVLLDDVMTSGATVSECARQLIDAGAANVLVTVAARAVGVS